MTPNPVMPTTVAPPNPAPNREDVNAYISYLEEMKVYLDTQNRQLYDLCDLVNSELLDQIALVGKDIDPEVRESIMLIAEKFDGHLKERPPPEIITP